MAASERGDQTAERGRRRLLAGARSRILASIVILLVLSEVVALVAQRQLLLGRASERVDETLSQEVEEFRRLVRDGNNPLTGEPFGDDVQAIFDVFLQRNVLGEDEAIFTFLGGQPYAASAGEPTSLRLRAALLRIGDTAQVRRGDVETADGEVRYLAVPVVVAGQRQGAFVVTNALGREQEDVTEALRVSAGVSLIVLAAACVLAYVLAGRVLAPLRGLTVTARAISESDLTRRIDVTGDDEVAEAGHTFNAMLDRLESAFASQRAFVSDAGHELRTPITIVRGHLELLGDDPQEREETLELVMDELDRMSRIVDDLLTLAKAEQTDFLRLETVDLDVLSEELAAKASTLAERDWQLESSDAGVLVVDRQRLTQAVMNLAANAAQHTHPGDRIVLGSAMDGDGLARLWVRDTGPGVPADQQERIFERFARAAGGRRRSDGAGLGLAIVRAIAEAHGGRVTLDSRPGEGTTFTVVVPREPPQEVPEQ